MADYAKYRSLAGVLSALALLYMAAGAWFALETPFFGFGFEKDVVITRVYAGSPAEKAGIKEQDRILSVDGLSIDRPEEIHRVVVNYRSGDIVRCVVEREGRALELPVTLERPSARFLYLRLSTSIVALSFLLSGIYVFWRRPAHVTAVFYLFCLAIGFELLYPPRLTEPVAAVALPILHIVAAFTFASFLFYLFLIFPRTKELIQNHPWVVRTLFYLAGALATMLILVAVPSHSLDISIPESLLKVINHVSGLTLIGYVVFAITAFLHSYFTAPRGPSRTGLRVMLAGILFGLVPVLAQDVASRIDPRFATIEPYVLLLLVLVPLSFGYAILRAGTKAQTA